ncbi:hemicentin-1-like [Mytilus californianus]|uniref:hemicentin-1-like n=1 Tax=Mytilus californianus TaxID=6549 RepID=UPI002247F3CA|nr:hemicentin-1-like [Mytilus californianus]
MEYLFLLIIIYMNLMLGSSQIPPGSPVIDVPQVIVLNSQITFLCTSPRGSPTPTVKWFKDDTEITTGISTTTSGTAVTTSLTFTATLDDHLEIFECQAENGVLQNPLTTTKYIEVHYSPHAPTLTAPSTFTPGQQGMWTCISANGYPAGIMTMRNKNKNTQFTSEFTSFSVLNKKSYDVTGTLTWSPVIVNNGDTICCDVTHTTTLGITPQTVCRQITVAQPIAINAPVTQYNPILQSSVTLQCDVTQGTASQIIWIKDNVQLNIGSNSRLSGGTVATESLTIANVQMSDSGNYHCRGIDAVTGNIVNTDTINVNTVGTPPVASIPQTSYYSVTGQQIILGCTVSSPNSPLQDVQWTFINNGGQVTDPILVSTSNGKYSGSTINSPSLTINNIASTDAGTYSCKARNLVGTSTNNPTTTLTANGSLPVVQINPSTYTATYGSQVVINCNIVSASPAATQVYWQRNSDNQVLRIDNGDQGYQGSTTSTPSLTINFATTAYAGVYTCFATNVVGTGNSNLGTVTITGGGLDITASRTTYSAIVGDSIVTILCNINGTPPAIAWDWTKTSISGGNSEIISQGTNNARRQVINSATKPNLNIYSMTEDDEGVYRCRANNGERQYISEPVILKVQEASFRRVPGEPQTNNALDIEEGITVILTCSSSGGNPSPSVVWLKDNILINAGTNSSIFGNVTTTTLTFVTTVYDDLEVYECQVDNGFLQRPLVKSTYLVLNPSNKPPGQPIITGSQRYDLGDTVTISCSSTGGNPSPTVNWLRDNNIITTGINRFSGSGVTRTTLTFVAGLEDHLEVFECRANNGYLQNPLASTTYIELYFAPRVPTLTGPSTLLSGSSGKWICSSANGYPAPTISIRIQDRQYTNEIAVVQSYDIIDRSYTVAGTLNLVPSTDKTGQDLCCDVIYLFDNNDPQSTCLQLTINDEDEDTIIIYVVIGIFAVLILFVLLIVMIWYRRCMFI